jgi:hypothetical protein
LDPVLGKGKFSIATDDGYKTVGINSDHLTTDELEELLVDADLI